MPRRTRINLALFFMGIAVALNIILLSSPVWLARWFDGTAPYFSTSISNG